jgi:predicted dehydrogenase
MAVGIAVIGAGHWGPHLVRNFSDLADCRVHWLIEPDPSRREALRPRFHELPMSDDVDAALTDPEVDAVVIATPTVTHHGIARRALRAGKHVLVEKPITDSLAGAIELCELAEASGLTLMVGHVFLFNPAVRAAKSLLEAGEVGSVHYISMRRTNLGPVRRDVNAAWDLASHDISIASYWLEAEPRWVAATGGSWLNPGIDDAVFVTMGYPGEVVVHIEASWLNPRKIRDISVVGESKMLTIDDMDLSMPLRIHDKGVMGGSAPAGVADTFGGFRSQIREGAITIPKVPQVEPLRAECDSFVARVRGSDDQIASGRTGAAVVAVLEAIDRSLKNGGRQVALDEVGA